MIEAILGLIVIGVVIIGMLGIIAYALSPLLSIFEDMANGLEKRAQKKATRNEKIQALLDKREALEREIEAKKKKKKGS